MTKARILIVFFSLVFHFVYTQTNIDSLKTVVEISSNNQDRLQALDVLTTQLVRSNSEEQEDYIRDYLSLASSLQEFDLMASKSRFLIQYLIYQNKLEQAKALCDSLLEFKPYFQKANSEAHLLLKRGGIYFKIESYDLAIQDYAIAKELFLKSGDSIFAADAYYFAGEANSNKNAFLEAIKDFKKALHLYEILGDDTYALLAGSEISSLYTKNGFFKKALQERAQLIQKAKENKDAIAQAQLIAQNMVDYYKLVDYDNMYKELEILSKLKDSIEDSSFKSYHEVITMIYELIYHSKQGNVETADELMSQFDKKLAESNVSARMESDILVAKAVYFEMKGDQENLFPILERFASINTTIRLDDQIQAREKLVEVYQQRGQLNRVIALNKINSRLKDSIYNARKTNAFLLYQSEFEAEQKQHQIKEQASQIKQLEAEQELASNRRNTLIGVIIFVFVIALGFFYFRNQQKIKEQAYQNILLNNEVATKTEEINELLTETIQHIKSKERIAENLQKLSNEKEGITLKSIIADLKASKADHAKLLLIKQNIEQVNFEFIKKLKGLHPELSKTDIEICSLARIGLSRKEVANLRNTSIDAVKMARIRIKKKLNLPVNQKLDDYINTL